MSIDTTVLIQTLSFLVFIVVVVLERLSRSEFANQVKQNTELKELLVKRDWDKKNLKDLKNLVCENLGLPEQIQKKFVPLGYTNIDGGGVSTLCEYKSYNAYSVDTVISLLKIDNENKKQVREDDS